MSCVQMASSRLASSAVFPGLAAPTAVQRSHPAARLLATGHTLTLFPTLIAQVCIAACRPAEAVPVAPPDLADAGRTGIRSLNSRQITPVEDDSTACRTQPEGLGGRADTGN